MKMESKGVVSGPNSEAEPPFFTRLRCGDGEGGETEGLLGF